MNETTAPSLASLFGGKQVTVTYRAAAARAPRVVTVREMKPSEMAAYLSVANDMNRLVEFVCGLETGEADLLQPASLFELSDAVGELNDPTFGPWLKRQGPKLRELAQIMGSPSISSASALASP